MNISNATIGSDEVQTGIGFPIIPVTDQDLLDNIERISISSAREEKERHLFSLASSASGRKLIELCYNPFLTWGVTQKAMPTKLGESVPGSISLPAIEALLNRLASRELSGNAARAAVADAFATLPAEGGKLLWLCLNKDLKAGVAEASICAIDPNLLPAFAVMRAETYEEKRVTTFPVAVEPKLDGFRVTFIAKDGSGGFYTRTGKIIPDLDHMIEPTLRAIKHWAGLTRIVGEDGAGVVIDKFLSSLTYVGGLPQLVLDGEMMPDSGQFNDVKRAMKEQRVIYNVFDMLSWQEFDAMGAVAVSYMERRSRAYDFTQAASFVSDRLKLTHLDLARSHDEIDRIYRKHRAAGQEGAMVKLLDGNYHKKKSFSWLKIKAKDTEDLPIIGVFQGKAGGKYENTLGGFIVDRQGVEVRVPGIDDATRAECWELWCQTAKACGFVPDVGYEGASFKHAIEMGNVPTILLGRLIEVEFHEVTPDGSLRHPRFIQFRDDKTGEIEK